MKARVCGEFRSYEPACGPEAQCRGGEDGQPGCRAVVQLLLLIAVAAARCREQLGAGPSGYVSVYGLAALTAAVTDAAPLADTGWLPALLSADGGSVAALLFGTVAAVLRVFRPGERRRYLLLAATAVFTLEALALSLVEDAWMTPVALLGAAVLFFVLSHREQLPWLYAAGAVSVLAAALALIVACHEHGTVLARFWPVAWDHLFSQSWDRPARLAGGSRGALFDHRVSIVDAEVNRVGIQGGQCG